VTEPKQFRSRPDFAAFPTHSLEIWSRLMATLGVFVAK